ncbi:hypothetical protein ACFLYA_00465, partial [Candidatus Dependentiae bacterium]
MKIHKKFFFTLLSTILFFLFQNSYCGFSFDSRYSTIRVASGATFSITNPIANFNGTLIKESGATITGANITFADGIIEDEGNSILLFGVFDPDGTIYLSGEDTFRADPGRILQSVMVSGTGNRLEGMPLLQNDITLQNSGAELLLAVKSDMSKDIILNGGTVNLESDLAFSSDSNVSGDGIIVGNGCKFSTGNKPLSWSSNIVWNSDINLEINSPAVDFSGTFTFNGTSAINGNGNIIDLASGGNITIGNDATLYLSDIAIKGVGSSGGSITFGNDNSKLRMSNVTIELVGNTSTTQGDIYVDNTSTWIIKNYTWTIDTSGKLTIDGVTLWKDAAGEADIGNISFGVPESNFLTLIASGTIKDVDFDSSYLQSQIDANELGIATNQTNIATNMVSISNLETATVDLRSLIDGCYDIVNGKLQDEIDALKTSTGELKDLIDVNASDIAANANAIDELETSTGELKDLIDTNASDIATNQTDISSLETSTGELRSLIDINIADIATNASDIAANTNAIDDLETSTGELKDLVDTNALDIAANMVLISNLETTTAELRSLIDECCDVDCESLLDEIDALKTSTGELKVLIDTNALDIAANVVLISNLETTTVELRSLIDYCCDTEELQSEIDDLKTSTGELRGLIDINISDIATNALDIAANTDAIDELETTTVELRSLIDYCCDTGELQGEIDDLKTSTGELKVLIDTNVSSIATNAADISANQASINVNTTSISNLETSTGELKDLIDTNASDIATNQTNINTNATSISNLETTTVELRSLIDYCCDSGELQSEIDDLKTSTGELKVLIDTNVSSIATNAADISANQASINVNTTSISNLETTTVELRSLIDYCCDSGELQSEIDELKTSTGELKVLIDTNALDIAANVVLISNLETTTGELRSLIDYCC